MILIPEEENKCKSCIGRLEYKTAIPCRYCRWNKEPYWGRRESKMIEDHYRFVDPNIECDLPY